MPWKKSLHWLALRQVDGIYYNLDSDLQSPLIVGNEDDMKSYLQTQLENDDKHLLIVVTSQVAALNSWLGCEENK
jgi:josephin